MPTLYPTDLREEELKLRVAKDFFSLYDTTHIVGSIDEHFNTLMDNLRLSLQTLAKQIEPKVYQYGFLK